MFSGPARWCSSTMRKLKHHEQRLLRKVDFLSWKSEQNLREIKILRRYYIQDREDYVRCVATISPSPPGPPKKESWERLGGKASSRSARP